MFDLDRRDQSLGELMNNLRKDMKKAAPNHRVLASTLAAFKYVRLRLRKTNPENGILETIGCFVDPVKQQDKKYIHKLMRQMLFARYYYQWEYKEFFFYRYAERSGTERRQYIGWFELKELFDLLNRTGRPDVFECKEKTYQAFKEFYHRDALYVENYGDEEAFLQFVREHVPCLLKPLHNYGGKGIVRFEYTDDEAAEKLFQEKIRASAFLMEEMIRQDPEMAKFHPQSVNTIRYITFFHEGKLTCLQADLRIGRGDSFVDNATSGGIYALVDWETGIVLGPARSENGEEFLTHPDTGVQVAGAQIPRWDELNALIEKVVRVIPEQKQVGWDFALSEDGWVMVEANTFPALQSFDWDHGMREMITGVVEHAVSMNR